MKETPLFTAAIVAYKNYRFIRESIDSVLMQDYENIELIVSNDGSDDFDEDELLRYLEAVRYDHPNIKAIKLNNNERNLGTCKHLNVVKAMAQGKYIMFLAADDAFHDSHSISHIVRGFSQCGEPLALCGRCGMYDLELKGYSEIAPRAEVVQRLREWSPEDIYKTLVTDMYIPTAATTYNMQAFETLGDFDERVFLVEDWAFFLKMTRSGYKPGYIDVEVTKHRDGGGCHGNESGIENFNRNFQRDEMTIMDIEIMPYLPQLGKKLAKTLTKRRRFLESLWVQRYEFSAMNKTQKCRYILSQFPLLLQTALERVFRKVINKFLTHFRDPAWIIQCIFLYLLANYTDFSAYLGEGIDYWLHIVAAWCCILSVALYLCGFFIRAICFVFIPAKKGIKKVLKR